MDYPTLVRIEGWNVLLQDWTVRHAAINLMNPAAYVEKLAKRGTIARAVEVDTGEMVYGPGADLL